MRNAQKRLLAITRILGLTYLAQTCQSLLIIEGNFKAALDATHGHELTHSAGRKFEAHPLLASHDNPRKFPTVEPLTLISAHIYAEAATSHYKIHFKVSATGESPTRITNCASAI